MSCERMEQAGENRWRRCGVCYWGMVLRPELVEGFEEKIKGFLKWKVINLQVNDFALFILHDGET